MKAVVVKNVFHDKNASSLGHHQKKCSFIQEATLQVEKLIVEIVLFYSLTILLSYMAASPTPSYFALPVPPFHCCQWKKLPHPI
jgi:hypothetical protein